jgi:hypothetical protein
MPSSIEGEKVYYDLKSKQLKYSERIKMATKTKTPSKKDKKVVFH